MLDIEIFRNWNEEFLKDYSRKRNIDFIKLTEVRDLDIKTRKILTSIQNINQKINTVSSLFETYIKNKENNNLLKLREEVRVLKSEKDSLEKDYEYYKNELLNRLKILPNIPGNDVPYGLDESNNVVVKVTGKIPNFNFKIKPHWDLLTEKQMVDFEASQIICGSRYVIYKGMGALFVRALQWYTLECNIKHGSLEILPPVIVQDSSLYNTGQLPKFKEDLYKIENEDRYLSPTAEVQLTNLHANSIISNSQLPLSYTANTSCFRSEAGSAGRDTRGIIRQHQFYKSEIVKICSPEDSEKQLNELVNQAEYILESLKLPYRRLLLCSNDMGFSAKKTYDLEVWLPSYNSYKEISSCSNCGDFQARRMKMRLRTDDGQIIYPHTLNGSALAIDRLLAAIIENYQQEDGSIIIPDVLRKYFGNKEKI